MRTTFAALLLISLAACGTATGDRAASGGLIGTAGAVAVGGALFPAVAIGAGVGALTDSDELNLGRPIWE
jgi:osmotically inducible lipoprotein OsmB